jgi:hypothetical protein
VGDKDQDGAPFLGFLVWSKNSKLEVGKHNHFSIGFFVHDFKPRVSFMSDHDALRA